MPPPRPLPVSPSLLPVWSTSSSLWSLGPRRRPCRRSAEAAEGTGGAEGAGTTPNGLGRDASRGHRGRRRSQLDPTCPTTASLRSRPPPCSIPRSTQSGPVQQSLHALPRPDGHVAGRPVRRDTALPQAQGVFHGPDCRYRSAHACACARALHERRAPARRGSARTSAH